MKLVTYLSIKHLLPADSLYKDFETRDLFPFQKEAYVWFHEGDFTFFDPLSLDEVNKSFNEAENEKYPILIFITGTAQFSNIFNDETDGATGLLVLGDLYVQNMVVGGQEIYVGGNLLVSDLFWGDYNHGNLNVKGLIKSRVFINTDYGTDQQRFQYRKDIDIEFLLSDDQDDYDPESDLLRALVNEQFLYKEEDIFEDYYSWSVWLKKEQILEALAHNESMLLKEWNRIFLPKGIHLPAYFDDDEISEQNLQRFGASNMLQYQKDINCYALQYWEGDWYRAVYNSRQAGEIGTVYFQDDEFAYMIYMGKEKSLLQKVNKVLATAYRKLPDGEWLNLEHEAPEQHRIFLHEQWQSFIDVYTKMHYWWNRFLSTITTKKLNQILSLPMIVEKYYDYYNDDHVLFHGSYEWNFRPKNEEEKPARISIIKNSEEENFVCYHYQLQNNQVCIMDQDQDGYDANIYEVQPHQYEKVKEALLFFEKLEKHIFKMNENYTEDK